MARQRAADLGITNLEIIHEDFARRGGALEGRFDYIVGHGIFSWIPEAVRDDLLELCERHLAEVGLLYLSYNARPGWDFRGMLRDFLLRATRHETESPGQRARSAQQTAATLAQALSQSEHDYSRLLAGELDLIRDAHHSYVGHDYLAPVNQAYWREDFLDLLADRGFVHVGDADFNYSSGRVPDDLDRRVEELELPDHARSTALDLMIYRQFHCPVLTRAPLSRSKISTSEFSDLYLASCLEPPAPITSGARFTHPSGYEVELETELLRDVFARLRGLWPMGMPLGELFSEPEAVREDILLLQRSGLLELRLYEPRVPDHQLRALHQQESRLGYRTSPYHTVELLA